MYILVVTSLKQLLLSQSPKDVQECGYYVFIPDIGHHFMWILMPPGPRYGILWYRKMTESEIYGFYIESLDNIKDIIDFIQPWPEAA